MKLPSVRVQRNTILFVSGLAGIAHQTVIENAEKPTLIVLFAAMIGLPAFLRTDEKKKDEDAAPAAVEQTPAATPETPPPTPPPASGGTP